MGRLTAAALPIALGWSGLAAAGPTDRWAPLIAEASSRFNVPLAWIERVIRAESGGRTILNGRPIVSHAGAMGLMQLMPGTWREMRARHGLGPDPHDPRDNIIAGTAYLRLMHDRFGYPGLFAAYNAGPARFATALRTGRRLPAETRAYVANVTGNRPAMSLAVVRSGSSGPNLFAIMRRPAGAGNGVPDHAAAVRSSLFFVRVERRPGS